MEVLTPKQIREKNKIHRKTAMLALLEIDMPAIGEVIRLVYNTEPIEWNGETWRDFPFEVSTISESMTPTTAQIEISVANVNGEISKYIEDYDYYVKTQKYEAVKVKLMVVNSGDLDNLQPYSTYVTKLLKPATKGLKAVFTLSTRDLQNSQAPVHAMLPNVCTSKFKSAQCGYEGTQTTCDGTLARCRELNNSTRYRGFNFIGNSGVIL